MPTTELKKDDRVELLEMPDDPDPVPIGTKGTIESVDELYNFTQVSVRWDNGRSLMLSIPPDQVRVLR
jgi:hypothetical protein